MTTLEKIVFIADYIEPGRDQAPHLDEIRKAAFENLDLALCMILKDTLSFLKENEREIDSLITLPQRRTLHGTEGIGGNGEAGAGGAGR